jgi:uncharacterized protein (TIGR03437 family)
MFLNFIVNRRLWSGILLNVIKLPTDCKTGLLALCLTGGAAAQTFSGFTSGNLVVTRSVYTGSATTVTVGQALPNVCPTSASCGKGKATDTGTFPSIGSTGSVWNNSKPDGSFSVNSPIFLDQITPTGTVVNTLAVPPSLLTAAFNAKLELAVNLSADGGAITLMGYLAPQNTLDVADSNTPGVYDPTNPAGGSYYRGVLQVGANGAMRVTPVNAFSGTNGRAVALAGGQYYMAGNSNNGSGTAANIVAATGVQMATPDQLYDSPVVQVGNFSISQVNDPSTGMPYAPDKAGKDSNFRGLTIFNNTLYVSKGSGSNGINTVYQAGTAGALPTLANAATTPLTILPGFPTTLAKNSGAAFPFGIWFANATTLYVADEGDGTNTNAAGSATAGLQKWILVNGTWQLAYVLQKGLNLGQPYSVNGYPTALNPSADGLRNIIGRVNSDGTVTIWGVTSTISGSEDQGADPNQLVSINDVLANTTAAGSATEQFSIIKSAGYGEVLRGVSFAPTTSTPAIQNSPTIVSAAAEGVRGIAPGSLATAIGQQLGVTNSGTTGTLPTSFMGTSVAIIDSTGASSAAPLLYVGPTQINFEVPRNVAAGTAQVTITSSTAVQTAPNIQIAPVTPGLFVLNNSGLAAALCLRVSSDGTQTFQNVYVANADGTVAANPINLGSATDKVYLELYGTGLQSAGVANIDVTVAGVDAPILYSGPQGTYEGLDQVNIQIPPTLSVTGNVTIQLTAGGIRANPVEVTLQ